MKQYTRSEKRLVLITGGSRSGKSSHALVLAETFPGPRYFVATCPPLDEEMAARILRHKKAREGSAWVTIEETTDLAGALSKSKDAGVVLIDCLTLWINNLLFESHAGGASLTEEIVSERCRRLMAAISDNPATVILVTNEVGMGIIPENPVSRLYRDLAGRCNQVIAEAATEVYLMVSGLPLRIK